MNRDTLVDMGAYGVLLVVLITVFCGILVVVKWVLNVLEVSFFQFFFILLVPFGIYLAYALASDYLEILGRQQQQHKCKKLKSGSTGWGGSFRASTYQTRPDGSRVEVDRSQLVGEEFSIIKYHIAKLTQIFYKQDGQKCAVSVVSYWDSVPRESDADDKMICASSTLKDSNTSMVEYGRVSRFRGSTREHIKRLDEMKLEGLVDQKEGEPIHWDALQLDKYNRKPPKTIYERLNGYESGHLLYMRRESIVNMITH